MCPTFWVTIILLLNITSGHISGKLYEAKLLNGHNIAGGVEVRRTINPTPFPQPENQEVIIFFQN